MKMELFLSIDQVTKKAMRYTSGINTHLGVFAVLSQYIVRNKQYAYRIVSLLTKERTPSALPAQHNMTCSVGADCTCLIYIRVNGQKIKIDLSSSQRDNFQDVFTGLAKTGHCINILHKNLTTLNHICYNCTFWFWDGRQFEKTEWFTSTH